ncbi:MAG: tetratricopeptide repeat protein [Ignavibacteriaceae bacterium]
MKLFFYQLLILFITIFSISTFSQSNNNNQLKTEALQLMDAGRFGEAIDQLNKFVSANPNSAEGFNLRGTCYEKRGNYEYAVYDFRTAAKLKPKDDKIRSNLNRTISNWYKILYNKIEGHKREIAINPNVAKNYLEIGKCYKNLGEWNEAEIWYDLYLEKENASSDEIIRYSEILAKNNHISKGEPILKDYTTKFPDDHRLWSRYGYFTLWLGKNKIAIDAFSQSLEIRPFFKEAMDGLDLAKGKGYIYSINDTTARFNYGLAPSPKEYIIDKYFRILKTNPSDSETRFKLVEELIVANRYEEAIQQLKILAPNYSEEERFKDLWFKVSTLRNSYYADRIKYFNDLLSKNPNDTKSILELAKYYSYNGDFNLAINLYKNYLNKYPNDDEIQFKYAQILMWQNNLCEAVEISQKLADKNPEKLEFLIFAAKVNSWLDRNPGYSQSLYEKVLVKDPTNKEAMIGLANLFIRNGDIDLAKQLMDEISLTDSLSEQLILLRSSYNSAVNQKEIVESHKILDEARKYAVEKDYDNSIIIFKKYLKQYPENQNIKLELADVYSANNQLKNAVLVYQDILSSGSNYDVEMKLAKTYLWNKDSLIALSEFKKLNQKNPQDIEAKLLLGDAYLQAGQVQNAKTIYQELLEKSPESHILKTRLSWIGGSDKFSFQKFPTYIQLIPRALYFIDNNDFSYSNMGIGFDLGVTNFLTIGFSGSRGKLASENEDLRFNQIKGSVYARFNNIISANAGFGQTFFLNERKENIFDFSINAFKKDIFNVTAFVNFSDAAFILYSPFLVSTRLNAYNLGLSGEYRFKNNLIVSAKYSNLAVSDDNSGNQLQARLGKIFNPDISAGYEYYFYNIENETNLYWSPNNFESHSLWVDWVLYKDEEVNFTLGGKFGLIPNNDYLVSEFYADFKYQIIKSLFFQTRFSTGSSFRSNSGYRSNSIQASLILNL